MSVPVVMTFRRDQMPPSSSSPDLIASPADLARAAFSWHIEVDVATVTYWPSLPGRLTVGTPGVKLDRVAMEWIRGRLTLGVHVEFSSA